jgi:hypothetical protein
MVFLNPRQTNHKSAVPGFRAFFWREGGKAQRPFSRRVFAQLAGFAGAAAGVVAGTTFFLGFRAGTGAGQGFTTATGAAAAATLAAFRV